MDKIDINAAVAPDAIVENDFDFEVEDVSELDIFAPLDSLCSSTTSSSSCCG